MDWLLTKLLILPGIILGLTFHEYAHAKVASMMGDNTAKELGRVSLNPLRHIDIIGFICLIVVGFGWGKPVPVNPYNLSGKNRKFKEVAISAAGVIMNLVLAILLAIVLTWIGVHHPALYNGNGIYLYDVLYYAMYINIVLMIFNLIPIPPLDGFNVLSELTGIDNTPAYDKMLQYGSIILIILLVFNIIDLILTPGINWVLKLINAVLGVIF